MVGPGISPNNPSQTFYLAKSVNIEPDSGMAWTSSDGQTTNVGQLINPQNPVNLPPVLPNEQPLLQPNLMNQIDGDLVSGEFDPDDASHLEDGGNGGTYTRTDFNPVTNGGANANQGAANSAFLARLRRTGETSETGISNAWPAVPALFSVFRSRPANNGGVPSFPVRATAIADAKPAIYVGPGIPYTDTQGQQQTIVGLLTTASGSTTSGESTTSSGSTTTSIQLRRRLEFHQFNAIGLVFHKHLAAPIGVTAKCFV